METKANYYRIKEVIDKIKVQRKLFIIKLQKKEMEKVKVRLEHIKVRDVQCQSIPGDNKR